MGIGYLARSQSQSFHFIAGILAISLSFLNFVDDKFQNSAVILFKHFYFIIFPSQPEFMGINEYSFFNKNNFFY